MASLPDHDYEIRPIPARTQAALRAPLALVPEAELPVPESVSEPASAPSPAWALDFDLPPALFGMMFGLLGVFLALMFATFSGADAMGIVGVICAVCLIGYFGVPFAIGRAGPRNPRARRHSLSRLLADGVETGDGHRTEGHEAVGLTLLLPIIMVGWAVAVTIIHAIVF